MATAEHNPSAFPMARKVAGSMTHQQLHDFASGSMKGKPAHVASTHPHKNLGAYLHPKKSR